MKGFLALVLHAHLPFVFHPEVDDSIEEHWLFQAITETYIPLLRMFHRLKKDGIQSSVTLSLSPTLLEMLQNQFLLYRYRRYLERLLVLAQKEEQRNRSHAQLSSVSLWHKNRVDEIYAFFHNKLRDGFLEEFKRLQEDSMVEILGSTATHGFLPLLQYNGGDVSRQIDFGLTYYRNTFQRDPQGFWLPECGYSPEIETELVRQGMYYTFLETHGITKANPSPPFGVYEPIITPNQLAVFGRDPDSSRLVWSQQDGYPAHPECREFYRDIGYDLHRKDLGPVIHEFGPRVDTGLKYYRITGHGNEKGYYNPSMAKRLAIEQAKDFVCKKSEQIIRLRKHRSKKPLICAPFDAELFGHWWGEGVVWLEAVIREIARGSQDVEMTTISQYLKENSPDHVAEPALSSWGARGYNAMWLQENNAWVWPKLRTASRMVENIKKKKKPPNETNHQRAIDQASRELLLAQASDWSFMVGSQSSTEYGAKRICTHVENIKKIYCMCHSSMYDELFLSQLENKNPFCLKSQLM